MLPGSAGLEKAFGYELKHLGSSPRQDNNYLCDWANHPASLGFNFLMQKEQGLAPRAVPCWIPRVFWLTRTLLCVHLELHWVQSSVPGNISEHFGEVTREEKGGPGLMGEWLESQSSSSNPHGKGRVSCWSRCAQCTVHLRSPNRVCSVACRQKCFPQEVVERVRPRKS